MLTMVSGGFLPHLDGDGVEARRVFGHPEAYGSPFRGTIPETLLYRTLHNALRATGHTHVRNVSRTLWRGGGLGVRGGSRQHLGTAGGKRRRDDGRGSGPKLQRSSIRAESFGSEKSRTTSSTPCSSSSLGSWVEAIPTVGIPAATEEAMPKGESSKARASSFEIPRASRAAS